MEKSRGKLTMMVLRDDRKFLVSIPEVADSAPNSEEDRRRDSSSELEGEDQRKRGWDGAIQSRDAGGAHEGGLLSAPPQKFLTSRKTPRLRDRHGNPTERNARAGTEPMSRT